MHFELFRFPPSVTNRPKSKPPKQPLPAYERATEPPPMMLTERDRRILETVHTFDGVLADYQIQSLLFTGRTQMQLRTRLLFHHGYLNRPTRRQRAALPCMIYWLAERGAKHVAGLSSKSLDTFSWRRSPKWSQIDHDLAVNDFRLAVIQTCARNPQLTFEEWIPQTEFWARPDTVEYTLPTGQKRKRKVRPDGYCAITHHGKRYRLLLELDRATEDNPRFTREKVYPGIAYLTSDVYQARFGAKHGWWLVVTTGERRLTNMKRHTERAAGRDARWFFFTTMKKIADNTVLTAPIWVRGGESASRALFDSAA